LSKEALRVANFFFTPPEIPCSEEILTRIFHSLQTLAIHGVVDFNSGGPEPSYRHSQQTIAKDFLPDNRNYEPIRRHSRVSNRINGAAEVTS